MKKALKDTGKFRLFFTALLVVLIAVYPEIAKAEETKSEETITKAEGPKTAGERMWGKAFPLVRKALDLYDKEFSDVTMEAGFNQLYGRENKLDLKTRELCTVMLLTSIGKPEELNSHLGVGLNVGWKIEELREAMILAAVPAGWPAAIDANRFLLKWCETRKIEKPVGGEFREGYETIDWYKIGYEKGVKLFGMAMWQDYLNDIAKLDPDLDDFTVKNIYGKFLTRTLLDDRTKELLMVAAYAGLKSKKELEMHIAGALNSGAARDEVEEVIYHVALYAGMGSMTDALGVYKALLNQKKLQ